MRTLLSIAFTSFLTLSACGQGLINFFNNSTTLVSTGPNSQTLMSGPIGSYYFGVLTSQFPFQDRTSFTFVGLYATNQSVAGRFNGGAGVALPGIAAGNSFTYFIVGWSADLGHNWNQNWLFGEGFPTSATTNSVFGYSAIATGIAGGTTQIGTILPPFNLFGGTSGLQSGFALSGFFIPEPSAAILAAVGALGLGLARRRIMPRAGR